MMAKVIKAVAFANGVECPIAGMYLVDFDFEAYKGRGWGDFSPDIGKAKKFEDMTEALAYWKTQSKAVPLRPDGKPNRPLTSTTCEIVDDSPISDR